jgi:drug/metabolite transporter (DMT)-like permease
MLTIVLALASATGYGAADFLAGMAARRADVIQITLAVYAVGTVAIAAVLPWSHAGHPSAAALGWGAVSGAGLAAEALFLAAGFRRADFSVAAPLSAAVGAGLAVLAGLAWGERPGGYALTGLLLVLPAVLAVTSSAAPAAGDLLEEALPQPGPARPQHDILTGGSPDRPGRVIACRARRAFRRYSRCRPGGSGSLGGAALGMIAGIGGAVFLIGGARVGPAAGLWPVLAIQAAALVTTAVVAAVTGNLHIPAAGARWLSASSGGIGAVSALLYVAAAVTGMLAIAAAVTGLFPVVTVLLGRVVVKERLGVTRLAGLAMATAAVALIGIGR